MAACSSDQVKMPLYARHGVAYAWLLDPEVRSLEAYELIDGRWSRIGLFCNHDLVSVTPFQAIRIRLAELWV